MDTFYVNLRIISFQFIVVYGTKLFGIIQLEAINGFT